MKLYKTFVYSDYYNTYKKVLVLAKNKALALAYIKRVHQPDRDIKLVKVDYNKHSVFNIDPTDIINKRKKR